MHELTLRHIDLDRLHRLATLIVGRFPSKLVIGLVGTLGAGKTTLTQALASAAAVDPDDVTSPTFMLLCSYTATIADGKIDLHHLDAYRLSDEDEFLELGVDELFESEATWVVVEWADRVRSVMPTETLWIDLDFADSDGHDVPFRVITLKTEDPNLQDQLVFLAEAMKQ